MNEIRTEHVQFSFIVEILCSVISVFPSQFKVLNTEYKPTNLNKRITLEKVFIRNV